MINNKDLLKQLYENIVKISDVKECEEFFVDLCSVQELEKMAQRLEVAILLRSGETYEEVIKKTGISSATLSRVSRCLKNCNGYNKILDK